ncbi:hypothetical protein A2W24_06025 [Microgenomates group bacterium RBG_16_45_19]|nr:MAG: hypothetical protein A2W24_06025 [Microgenomates group bacterium RBG_16_45_19]
MSIKEYWAKHRLKVNRISRVVGIGAGSLLLGLSVVYGLRWQRQINLNQQILEITQEKLSVNEAALASATASLNALQADDQFVRNEKLTAEIEAIQTEYRAAVQTYENLIDLRGDSIKTSKLDGQLAAILKLLADRNWATASSKIKELNASIQSERDKAAAAAATAIPENVPVNNTPPGSGYARQQVQLDIGNYLVSIVSADLNSTRVMVDTASAGTCTNDCPVLALSDYVARSGAFAGINGPYFCPASYPSCQGKTNTFDTLIMNKNKVYFNSENNVYSTVPAVIFLGNSARFVGTTQEWGRDTGVDAVIAAQPRLVAGGNAAFGGDGDPKKGSKSNRSFIGATSNTVYIGVVHNATVAESARVLAALGIKDALNLDAGGSTALWSGGYKVGPGRALPMGILLVRK